MPGALGFRQGWQQIKDKDTEAACGILRQQGNEEEARKLQADLLKAQAEARRLEQGNR